MIDLTFVRMANEPARERKEKECMDKLIELFGCFLTGIAIVAFLLVISSIWLLRIISNYVILY